MQNQFILNLLDSLTAEIDATSDRDAKVETILIAMRRLKTMLDFATQLDEDGMITLSPRKMSYAEIFNERIKEELFNLPVMFQGYEMSFLKICKHINLPDVVLVTEAKFGYCIKDLTLTNLEKLSDELDKIDLAIHPKIINERSFFIRGPNMRCMDRNGNNIKPMPSGLASIRITLQGFKIKDGIKQAVWKLENVKYI